MTRIILAAAAAFALSFAAPALACPSCNDCPMHKDKVAAADAAEKKDAPKKCACGAKTAAECKCGKACGCHAQQPEKKDEGKKS